MPPRLFHIHPQFLQDFDRIVSGGQTGVDRGALDVAFSLQFESGGWCPKGRKAEDGVIPPEYPLRETTSSDYPQRTQWNVRDSDGTLVLSWGKPGRGTALTIRLAVEANKPYWIADISKDIDITAIRNWIRENHIRTLNIAGSRESSSRGNVYDTAREVLLRLFADEQG